MDAEMLKKCAEVAKDVEENEETDEKLMHMLERLTPVEAYIVGKMVGGHLVRVGKSDDGT
jgi:FixJ family two-component response regulator